MTTSELMKAMSEAGAPFDAILIAVRAIEAKEAEIAQRDAESAQKRAKDAVRKREERAIRRVRGLSTDCPRTVRAESSDPSLPHPPKDNNSNPPAPTHPDNTPAHEEAGSRSGVPAKPDGVSAQTWADFQSHRKAKRAPLTVSAMTGIVREAEKAGWPLEAALIETMARGWQSFTARYCEDKQPPGAPPGRSSPQPVSHLDHFIAKQQAGATR